ncbi:MAG: endolytic transglycosylase MltG [Candidatus Niyogibacteria bacterium CG10_big_fil_rev_8_21_14_0_10_42_19]|uniref:Endolytic murein transglycosylase n=1 Tax=Candidatus Niyogibacteria bacterium CG10_big_fil_rev_8_21_14_0_10_42_19 TaxID=1974725 RepID=A0A2H0TFN0_9BACT|nr:MAG: endolytic transglycosylase MltG [Candidatus Niyogibacteria bacterium CG10_big_fil_rev_8_21_14_0_10_42_19]
MINFSGKLRLASFVAGLFFFIIFLVLYSLYVPPTKFPSGEVFEIKKGEPLKEISGDLYRDGIIRSPSLFNVVVAFFYGEKSVKAGVYYFKEPFSLMEMAGRLTDTSSSADLLPVTIREGETLNKIGAIFEKWRIFSAVDFLRLTGFSAVGDWQNKPTITKNLEQQFILLSDKPEHATLEGYLFPDTYFFPPSISPIDAIKVMLHNFDQKISLETREEMVRRGKGVFEVIILASILEKEAFDGEDGRIISGILWKRLEIGMPLQADATIVYVLDKNTPLTLDDLEFDSPYNTYKYAGLPSGPISNPGLDAINSAVYPQDSSYWYYLHDKQGKAHYAETFEEHKLNKAKYLY